VVGTLLGTTVHRDHARYYGCLVDDADHRLLHYAEKPTTFVSDLINSGIYCFSPAIFSHIAAALTKLNHDPSVTRTPLRASVEAVWRPRPGYLRLEQDVLIPLTENKLLCVYRNNSFWRQVKNAGAVVYCNDLYLNLYANTKPELLAKGKSIKGNVIIHKTAKIHPTAVLGPNVSIGKNVIVGKGVRVLHSIVLDGAEIKDHACVLFSVIGWKCTIGQWARIEGIPNPTPDLYVNKKRKGICIVGQGSMVAPEILIRNCIVMPHKSLTSCNFHEILL